MNILYLDDEIEILELAQDYFSDQGISIDICTSPMEALQLVRDNSYDLIFSDAKMPEMSGLDFLQKIQTDLSYEGNFVLVSGHFEMNTSEQSPLGLSALMLKPVEFEELLRMAKKLVGKGQ